MKTILHVIHIMCDRDMQDAGFSEQMFIGIFLW